MQSFFMQSIAPQGGNMTNQGNNQNPPVPPVTVPVSAGGMSQQPAFFLRGVYQPLCFTYPANYTKAT